MKKKLFSLLLCLVLSLTACGAETEPAPDLDLDTISTALAASGYFPASLEAQDPGLVPGVLCLYEDRVEAAPEDVADARYSMALGIVADQFLLIEGADEKGTDRLEQALDTYAYDQKSAYEFYNPEQAARMDDPIVERRGNYLLFAVGEDMDGLADLCRRLMDGAAVKLDPPDGSTSTDGGQSVPPGDQSGGLAPLTEEELAAAHKAAYAYYKDTVFKVSILEEIIPPEGEIAFRVTCSRGGEEVPQRTICLERQEGTWTVVNEGY